MNPDREEAGQKYEQIRLRLTKFFARRGCNLADDLVDATFDRVANKVDEITGDYIGDPSWYFLRTAHYIHLEFIRGNAAHMEAHFPAPVEKDEKEYECLERCLQKLKPESRSLVLQYYQKQKSAKINNRKDLAAHLRINPRAMRMRIHRIKEALANCVKECLENGDAR